MTILDQLRGSFGAHKQRNLRSLGCLLQISTENPRKCINGKEIPQQSWDLDFGHKN